MNRSKKLPTVSMEICSERFKQTFEYYELKLQYSEAFLRNLEDDDTKIKNFYDLILPSLAKQVIIPEKSLMYRFVCFFPACLAIRNSFVNKQIFLRHLKELHSKEIPNDGAFLFLNNSSFKCDVCEIPFARREHLNAHMKTGLHQRAQVRNLVSINKFQAAIKWYPEWHDEKMNTRSKRSECTLKKGELNNLQKESNLTADDPPKSIKRELSTNSVGISNLDKKFKLDESDSDLEYMEEVDYFMSSINF